MYNKNLTNKFLMMVFVLFLTIPLSTAVVDTVTISPAGSGTVTVNTPSGIMTVTSSTAITVASGSQVTYQATPNSGYAFDHYDNTWGSESYTTTQNPWVDGVYADDTTTATFVASGSVVPTPIYETFTPVPTPNINDGPYNPTPTPTINNPVVVIKTRSVSIGEKMLNDLWNMLISIFYK